MTTATHWCNALLGLAVMGLGIVSCSGEAALAPTTPALLPACVVGWWQDAAASACTCPGRPECDASDCRGARVLGLLEDGTYVSGFATVSPEAESASLVGTFHRGSYSLTDTTIHQVPESGHPLDLAASCDGGELLLNHAKKVRASSWLVEALGDAGGVAGGEVAP